METVPESREFPLGAAEPPDEKQRTEHSGEALEGLTQLVPETARGVQNLELAVKTQIQTSFRLARGP